MLTFQLEGKLAGPWVKELADCWQLAGVDRRDVAVLIDVNAVTFVDSAGKELLAAMHARGASFACTGCWMKAVLAEITNTSDSRCCEWHAK
jgi:anti-anti-sigma regulatory factor